MSRGARAAMLLVAWSLFAPGRSLAEQATAAPAAAPVGEAAPAAASDATPVWRAVHVEAIERAWLLPAASLEARVERVRGVATRLGLSDVEPAARALLADSSFGPPLERARGAVVLAPGLPAAHAALAQALLAEERDVLGASGATVRALRAIPRHLDASLWLEVNSLEVLRRTLLWGGLLYLLVAGVGVLSRTAHDLGDLSRNPSGGAGDGTGLPGFARAALLASLLLLPALLGEGMVGNALPLFALAFLHGNLRRRAAAVLAASALVVALHPVAARNTVAYAKLGADPVVEAAAGVAYGVPSLLDTIRVQASAADPLASEARAIGAKRDGHLVEADAALRALAGASPDPRLLNNAANIRLLLGDNETAIELLEEAAHSHPSPVVLFNLSQAYGRAIRLHAQEQTLGEAQELDPELVERMIELQQEGADPVADLLVPTPELRRRLRAAAQPVAAGRSLRDPLAPGWLGGHAFGSLAAFGLVGLLALVVARVYPPSRRCRGCGERACPRCDRRETLHGLCAACRRVRLQPEKTDPGMRLARLTALHERQRRLQRAHLFSALLVPGSAGLLAGSTWLAGLGVALFTATAAVLAASRGALPDPLVLGGAAPLLFALAATLTGLAYVSVVAAALRRWRSR